MNYQKLMIVGNITADAEAKTSKKGDTTFTTFRVAVGDHKGNTTFFPVTLFGTRGEKLAEYLTKGRQVTVDGRVTISEKGYFNMIADRIELGGKPKKKDIPDVETDSVDA
jgi:single-strand DNA-binding protein